MNKEFVTYKIAKQLKELEFDQICLAWFSDKNIRICGTDGCVLSNLFTNSKYGNEDTFAAPLWQQAIDWFLSEYDISIEPYSRISSGWGCYEIDSIEYSFKIVSLNQRYCDYDDNFINKYSRYGAIQQGILKAIEKVI